MTLLSKSRSVNSPMSLPCSQTIAHPKPLAFITSTVSRMLASRSTIAGSRNGRRRILTSLNLSAIDMTGVLLAKPQAIESVSGDGNNARCRSRRCFTSCLKIQATVLENMVGDRFGGDDADRQSVSDNRHVAIFAHGHFVDDDSQSVSLL